ncbi:hypothetical protein SG34_000240 [Thalassomonas viridans]|uniref:Lipid/polyisoprenoid-binding YceI-like domain-containing protein n=1 Tax=Thalassomonas viridans TaxID=137584 RepID=A0AAE9Z5B4_9GAMM|nr:hypothetical protein [Thalassomonas viridans]WDE05417.1 hypothetical protein SG34_000240 [Thalassomonas viridans]
MKKTILASALLMSVLSGAAQADTVYVNGALHTLSKSDFVQSGNNYTAYIDVVGDHGQQLIFDVDAVVGGYGYQQITYQRICLQMGPHGCTEPDIREIISDDFRYVVELNVTCNGIAIGSDIDNKNEQVSGRVSNKYREVKLLTRKNTATGGNCRQLKVQVNGLELGSISNIALDVLVAEAF